MPAVLLGFVIAVAGARAAERPFDLQAFLDAELRAGKQRIVVPPGRYRVAPKNRQHLFLHDVQDREIIADGVEMICTETTRAVTFTKCRSVTLRGLAIDYDPLPFTQGRITAISADKKTHEVTLFSGYPPAEHARAFKYEIFRPDTRTLRCRDYHYTIGVVDSRRLRVVKSQGRAGDPEAVGDLVVIAADHAPGGSAPHAIECDECSGLRLERITLYASNCFGFLEMNCDGTIYDHCRIDRRGADDPLRPADPRLRSLNADAYHSKHARKGPAYLGCAARFMGDDAINICGDYHVIAECRGAQLRVLAKHRMNIVPGDPVELLAYDGTRLPDATAVRVEPDGKITEAERAFLLRQRMDEHLRQRACEQAFKVMLDRPATLAMGSLIASAARMGNGFRVEGCDFGFNRSRGILIKASRGLIAGNRLTENWGPAILVSPEFWWLESGSSNDVEIRDNTITGCRGTAIQVESKGGDGLRTGQFSPPGAHHRITITGNRIADSSAPNILVTSTAGLRMEKNDCRPSSDGEAIKTVNCEP